MSTASSSPSRENIIDLSWCICDTIRVMKRAALVGLAFVVALIATPGAQSNASLNPTAALLQELIRVDTSNPPGHEGQIDDLWPRSSARSDSKSRRANAGGGEVASHRATQGRRQPPAGAARVARGRRRRRKRKVDRRSVRRERQRRTGFTAAARSISKAGSRCSRER